MKFLILSISLFAVDLAIATAPPDQSKTVSAIRGWKSAFHEATVVERQAAWAELKDAYDQVSKLLSGLAVGGDMRDAYQLELVENALSTRSAEVSGIQTVHNLLRSDNQEMDALEFIRLRQALRRYRGVILSYSEPDRHGLYAGKLETIAQTIEKLPRLPNETEDQAFRDAVEWLSQRGQATDLLGFLRTHYSEPNVSSVLSSGVLQDLLSATLRQTDPVSEKASGMVIKGTSDTISHSRPQFQPDDQRALIRMGVQGTSTAKVIASRSKKRTTAIGNWSRTDFEANFPIEFTPDLQIAIGQIQIASKTHSEPQWATMSGRTALGQALGGALALGVARSKKAETAAQTNDAVKLKLAENLKAKTARLEHTANVVVDNLVKRKMLKTDSFPRVRFSTGPARVEANVHLEDFQQWSTLTPRLEPFDPKADATLRLHHSAMNNLTSLLAGLSIEEDAFRTQIFGGIFTQPEADLPTGFIIAQLGLAARQPLKVRFSQAGIAAEIRLQSFEVEEGSFTYPVTLQANYRLTIGAQGLEMIREAPVKIIPEAKADPEATAALAPVAERLLVRRLVPSASAGSFEFDGETKQLSIQVSNFSIHDDGWLDLSWKLIK